VSTEASAQVDWSKVTDRGAAVWYIYFLQLANGDIYVGSTDDLKRRYRSHSLGQVTSTRPFLPAKLKCYIAVETEMHARQLERYFKSGSGKAFAKKRYCGLALGTLPSARPPPDGSGY
jgi:putative endonuclease